MESKAFYNYKAGIFSDKTCSKNITMSDTFVVSARFYSAFIQVLKVSVTDYRRIW